MTINNLIKQYRLSKKQQADLNKKILNLQYKINDLKNASIAVDLEAQELKILIDFCIETGAEPSQAKLTYSINEMKDKIKPLDPTSQFFAGNNVLFTSGLVNNVPFNYPTYPTIIKGKTTI